MNMKRERVGRGKKMMGKERKRKKNYKENEKERECG